MPPTDDSVERARDRRYQRTYGITLAEYHLLLASQGGACWICRRKPRTRPLVVDHDHKRTGRAAVRGLLCGSHSASCNRLLGAVRDNPELLRRMAEYLEARPAQAVLDDQPV